jgi:branched-chain amino acid transport system ATP-binding protein
MLDLDGVDSYYGDSQVLFDVDLGVDEGQVVSIIGRNGAGKTTTLRSVMNLATVRRGTISFRGEEITGVDTTGVAKRGIGYVPEDRQVFGGLTVEENLRIATTGISDRDAHVRMAFDYFPALEELRTARGQHLSGGEQQMLAIARGLIGDNDLLLIDEPNEGLAPSIAADVSDSIVNLKDETTILLVSQSTDLVFDISDRIYAMEDGEVVFGGTPAEARAQDVVEDVLTIG